MELHVEIRSTDTEMDMDDPAGAVGVQLMAFDVKSPTRELWQQKLFACNEQFDRMFLTNDFGN